MQIAKNSFILNWQVNSLITYKGRLLIQIDGNFLQLQ